MTARDRTPGILEIIGSELLQGGACGDAVAVVAHVSRKPYDECKAILRRAATCYNALETADAGKPLPSGPLAEGALQGALSLLERVIADCDRLEQMQGYAEAQADLWLGPVIYSLRDDVRAALCRLRGGGA